MTGEKLHNGIWLPEEWPPDSASIQLAPGAVPYLDSPPAVIEIDVGRQLFIDDFLIDRSSLIRTFHQAKKHPANPVLFPDSSWEKGTVPFAMPFSDGVWFDPSDQKFKLWYTGNEMYTTCYAESDDGLAWSRPQLDVVPGTNIVIDLPRDSSTVWLDHLESDPMLRFKALQTLKHRITMREPLRGFAHRERYTFSYFASPDGIHWTHMLDSPVEQPIDDRSTFWFDPFRGVWVFSIRGAKFSQEADVYGARRGRTYRESKDLVAGLANLLDHSVNWIGADDMDPPHPKYSDFRPQLYNLDAVAYESVMVGLFSVHQGPENDVCADENIQKRNQITLGYSRDGFHWHKPDRRPFICAGDDDSNAWDWGNIQSAGGGFLVVGDRLYFYYSGRRLTSGYWDGDGATGLASLRRDGFASLDADRDGGLLVTRPVRFSGTHLFVNVAAAEGRLRVAVLTDDNRPIEGLSLEDCVPVYVDSTTARIRWNSKETLAALKGAPVRFRFELFGGSLYSFWISEDERGRSGGYVAAGGPGFCGGRDIG